MALGLFKNLCQNQIAYGGIDALAYIYQPGTSLLTNVTDMTQDLDAQPYGFVPPVSGYSYDLNGNLTEDTGKALNIEYNLVNLPQKVSSTNGEGDLYLDHSFGGTKVKKVSPNNDTRFYVNGVEVAPNDEGEASIESYHFGDGRIIFDKNGRPHFQYKITDHLGNTVVMFEDKNNDGHINTELTEPDNAEVLQRNHYYPFGMPMQGEWKDMTAPKMDYLYKG